MHLYSEKQIEKKLADLVKASGGISRKFVSPMQRAVVDRLIFWPKGILHMVELKTLKGKLTKLQIKEQSRMKDLGFTVHTLYGMDEVKNYIKETIKENENR